MAYKWNLQDQLEFLMNESKHPVEVLIESNVFLGYHNSANNYKKLQRFILVSNKNIIILQKKHSYLEVPSVRRYAQLSRDETPIDLIHWLHSSRIAPGIQKNFDYFSNGQDSGYQKFRRKKFFLFCLFIILAHKLVSGICILSLKNETSYL